MDRPTVLLAEDEPLIALDLKDELEALGYRVLQTDDVATVLELAAIHLPDFVILNFQNGSLPDGMAVARLLRVRYLAKVLFITGARPKDIEASAHYYAGHEVLYKPYTRKQLREFIFPEKYPLSPEKRGTFTE
jgi:DNA-binding response OmpR family regulator